MLTCAHSDDSSPRRRSWDLKHESCKQTFGGHSAPVVALAAVHVEGQFASSSGTNIKLWCAIAGEEACLATLTGHTRDVITLAVRKV